MLMTSAVNSASAIASSAYTEAKTTLPNKLQNGDIEVALATTAKKLSTAVGSSKKPVYVNSSGVVVESTYDLSELQSQINTKADAAITTSTVAGLAPAMGTAAAATIATQADEWVLTTTKGGTPTWRKLPSNAFKNTNTTYVAGSGLSLDGTSFSLKTGYSESGKNYKVQLDSSGNPFVNVPWTDTNTTYSTVTTSANGLMSSIDKTKFNTISTWYDGAVGTDSDEIINKWSEVVSFLDGVKETDTLDGLITAVSDSVNALKTDLKNGSVVVKSATNATNATTATKLGAENKGSATKPIYLNSGVPTPCTYTLSASVPSNAKFTDTTYDTVTSSVAGLAPKMGTVAAATIATQADEWVLTTTKGGTPSWRNLPVNAFNNTTYSFNNSAATLSWGTTTTIATVGGTNITVKMPSNPNTNTTYVAGSGLSLDGTSFSLKTGYSESGKNYAVKTDSSGNPYVYVPWTDTNTTYSLATTGANGLMSSAQVSKLAGIADGANKVTATSQLTNDSGFITGITKSMVTNALGYTPPTTNTTYDTVTSSVAGLAPKMGTVAAATIATQADEWVLTTTNGGTPTWRKLPSNAFKNTTYSFSNSAATLSWGTTTTIATVGGTNITVKMPSNPNTDTNTTYVAGSGLSLSGTSFSLKTGYSESGNKNYAVKTDSSGNPYVYVPWTDTNTTYSLATTGANGLMSSAQVSKLAGIADGANKVTATSQLTNDSGYITGINKTMVVNALGYTPPTTNTTYSNATTGAAGLMSAADKAKLDGIASSANAYSLPNATSSSLGGVKVGSNITVSGGTISLTKSNITAALGYTPPTSDTNTTYSTVTNSVAGLAPAMGTAAASTIGTQSTEWVLTTTSGGTPSWRKLPANAFNNTTYSFSNAGATLSWGTTTTIATVGGTNITVKMPSNPNTNTTYVAGSGLSLSGTSFSLKTGYSESGKNYAVKTDSSGNPYVYVPWTDTNTTYSLATTGANGLMSSAQVGVLNSIYNVVSPTAWDGVDIFGSFTNNCYFRSSSTAMYAYIGNYDTAVQIIHSGNLGSKITKSMVTTALGYTPPTSDTNTTYVAGSGLSLSGTSFSLKTGYNTNGKNYKVQLDSSGNPYVNVPWTDTNTTYSLATTGANGLMSSAHVSKLNTINNTGYYGIGDQNLIFRAYGSFLYHFKDNSTYYPIITSENIGSYANKVTATSQLTNDSGFITGITKSMVVNALGYTPPTTDTNTTYSTVTSSVAGLAPKIGTAAASTIGTQSTEWVLTTTNGGTPTWRKLPSNAFNNTTYSTATAGANGLMPAADKQWVDNSKPLVLANAWTGADTIGRTDNTLYLNTKSSLLVTTQSNTYYVLHSGNYNQYISQVLDSKAWGGYTIAVSSSIPSSASSTQITFVI